MTITADDGNGGRASVNFELEVNNIAPMATFNAPASVDEGSDFALSLTSPSDPSLADTTAGFTYAFDCGSGYGSFGTGNSASCPTNIAGNLTVKGRVRDKDGGLSEYSLTVEVLPANVPPTVSADNASVTVGEGTAAANTGTFDDANDSDDVVITASVGTVTKVGTNTGTWSWSFDTTDGPAQSQPVTITADDGNGEPSSADFELVVNNVAPSATFNNDGPVNEGTSFNLSLTDPFDPSPDDTTAAFEYAFDCGNGSGYGAFDAASSATCATDDNAVRNSKAKIRDKDGGETEYTADVTVNNVAPTVTITGPPSGSIYAVGTPVTFTGEFTDPGTADTHTAEWTFDSTTVAGVVNEAGGTVSNTLSFGTPGVYQIILKVTDDDGGEGSADTVDGLTAQVVVFDPNGGFVTGGGWINSPLGAYGPDPTLTGKASFGFVSKYQPGANTPTGQTEFQFKAGDLNFHSNAYEWLVLIVAGARAQFKGTGSINGAGNYDFMVTAIDGALPGGGGFDRFRIKITGPGGVVYDNQPGAGDNDDPTTTLGGGSIVIHQ